MKDSVQLKFTFFAIKVRDNEQEFVEGHEAAYIRACADGTTIVEHGRMAVLGAGGDGKTSFINRMTGRDFNHGHIVTDGIDAILCTIDATNCTEAWTEHNQDQMKSLNATLTGGLSKIMEEYNSTISQEIEYVDIDQALKKSKATKPAESVMNGEMQKPKTFSAVQKFHPTALAKPIISELHELHPQEAANCKSDTTLQSKFEIKGIKKYEENVDEPGKQSRALFRTLSRDGVTAEEKQQLIKVYHDGQKSENHSDIEIMDFGGQWVYQTVHHCFLRYKCVFILVVNLAIGLFSHVPVVTKPSMETASRFWASRKNSTIPYIDQIIMWLNTILSHMQPDASGEYPKNVIVVGTHKDQLSYIKHTYVKWWDPNLMAEEYFKQLESLLRNKAHKKIIRAYFAVDNKGGDVETFKELRPYVIEAIRENCDWNKKRPIRWLLLQKHLHELQNDDSIPAVERNLIPYEKVCQYEEQFKIFKEDIAEFCTFHHLRGDITYISPKGLQSFVIANPQWLINIFKAIFTLPMHRSRHLTHLADEIHLLDADGILLATGAFLKHVWEHCLGGNRDDQERMKYLVQLLAQFEIICPLHDTSSSREDGKEDPYYLVPSLLQWDLDLMRPDEVQWFPMLPSIYFRFHATKESAKRIKLGKTKTSDLFLPFAFFQRLVCRCSRELGWSFHLEKYQNKICFLLDEKLIILETFFQSVWIKLSIMAPKNEGTNVDSNEQSQVYASITNQMDSLIEMYHPNMWYDVCLNPCEQKIKSVSAQNIEECLGTTGISSLTRSAKPNLVHCNVHDTCIQSKDYKAWFLSPSSPNSSSPFAEISSFAERVEEKSSRYSASLSCFYTTCFKEKYAYMPVASIS